MQYVDLSVHPIKIRNSQNRIYDICKLSGKLRVVLYNSYIIPESDFACHCREKYSKDPTATVYDQAEIQRIQRRKLSASETKRSLAGVYLQVF